MKPGVIPLPESWRFVPAWKADRKEIVMTNTYWIDAAEFAEKGGWKEDSQFTHLMGSAYLIAADKPGIPVEDAILPAHP